MSHHAYKAKEILDDAKLYINPQTDPVMWDVVNGLSELAESIRSLHAEIDTLKRKLQ
jgi:hypothetical protein